MGGIRVRLIVHIPWRSHVGIAVRQRLMTGIQWHRHTLASSGMLSEWVPRPSAETASAVNAASSRPINHMINSYQTASKNAPTLKEANRPVGQGIEFRLQRYGSITLLRRINPCADRAQDPAETFCLPKITSSRACRCLHCPLSCIPERTDSRPTRDRETRRLPEDLRLGTKWC